MTDISQHDELDEEPTTRRNMLRWAGAAAVGGVVATIAADPAAAADPNDVVLGSAANAAVSATGIVASGAGSPAYGLGCCDDFAATPNAILGKPSVFGHALGIAFSTGVAGHSIDMPSSGNGIGVFGLDTGFVASGIGVKAKSSAGTGLVAEGGTSGIIAVGSVNGVFASASFGPGVGAVGSKGALQLLPYVAEAPPARVTGFGKGTLETDNAGNVWYCYEAGTPGKWRKLAGAGTAGAFHPITPTRVYDSRAAAPAPGPIASGTNRLVSVADGRDGAGAVTAANIVASGATAVAANITITGTTGTFGYLAINPGGNTVEGASTINWSAPGLSIANGVTLTLNTTRQLTVICNGGGTTHFIIDIAGYYL